MNVEKGLQEDVIHVFLTNAESINLRKSTTFNTHKVQQIIDNVQRVYNHYIFSAEIFHQLHVTGLTMFMESVRDFMTTDKKRAAQPRGVNEFFVGFINVAISSLFAFTLQEKRFNACRIISQCAT